MIWLEELTNRKKISRIFNYYSAAFPEEERRNNEQFLALAEQANAFVFYIKNENENVGYLVLWELSGVYFLEHFEIFPVFRNQNFGKEVLAFLTKKYVKIVLESEPETSSEMAKRRIGFYERNGFNIIEKNYLQPSYGEGKPEVPMYLLSNFVPESVDTLVRTIYKVVYD